MEVKTNERAGKKGRGVNLTENRKSKTAKSPWKNSENRMNQNECSPWINVSIILGNTAITNDLLWEITISSLGKPSMLLESLLFQIWFARQLSVPFIAYCAVELSRMFESRIEASKRLETSFSCCLFPVFAARNLNWTSCPPQKYIF